MAVVQPQGALRTLFTGPVSDALFSPDGSKLYVASGQSLFTIDRASGQVLKEYTLGQPLGAIDVSEDGRYVAVVYRPPNLNVESADFYRIDTTNGTFQKYSLPLGGNVKGAFRDVAFFDDGTAILTQQANDALSVHYDFAQAKVLPDAISLTGATLIASPDHSEVLVIDNSPFGILDVVTSKGGVIAQRIGNPDPYGGASFPIGVSPIGAVAPTNDLFIQGGGLFDNELDPVPPVGAERFIGGRGMFFSPAGNRLYVAQQETFAVVDTATWKPIAIYPLGGSVTGAMGEAPTSDYGNVLTLSNDGRYLSMITSAGLQLVDLQTVLPVATNGNDVITDGQYQYGLAGDDTLGGPGLQFMVGGEGNDTYFVDSLGDTVSERPGEGFDRVFTTVNFFVQGIEEIVFTGKNDAFLFGDEGDNSLTTTEGNNSVQGSGGKDTITTKGGNDLLDGGPGADKMTGGSGDDVYVIDDVNDIVIEIAGEGIDEVRTTLASYKLLDNFENLRGDSFDGQTLIGNAAANRIEGKAGVGGADTLIGKGGDDYYVVAFGDKVIEAVGEGRHTVFTEFNDYVLPDNVENLELRFNVNHGIGNDLDNKISVSSFAGGALLEGKGGNDTLITTDGADRLDGGSGADKMIGGKGDDTYFVDDAGDQPIELAGEGKDRVEVGFNYTLAANLEDLTLTGMATEGNGNAGANTLIGNAQNNVLRGFDGADSLNGGAGVDTLIGGRGADSYFLDDSGDILVENPGEGTDEVLSQVSHVLGANFERLILQHNFIIDGTGNDLDNIIFGNGQKNVLRGLGGDDILSSGGGADEIDGGDGYDIAVIPGSTSSFLGGVTVTGTSADDITVQTKFAGPIHLIDVEVLRFSDGDFAWDAKSAKLVSIGGAFRAFVRDGFDGDFGGNGTVFGTSKAQDITVLDQGRFVDFDPSFNAGGDVIRLPGSADDWRVVLAGSSAQLNNGFTSVTVPVGNVGTSLVFADGARLLRFDNGTVRIGAQILSTTSEYLTAPADTGLPGVTTDPAAIGRMLLPQNARAVAGGNLTVFGTAEGHEQVTLTGGKIVLDPSFNRGGDTLILPGDAEDYSAARSGSAVVLSAPERQFSLPIGPGGLALDFGEGDERILSFDTATGILTIGAQQIVQTPVQLTDFA